MCLQGARQQLEKAEALAAAGGFEVADWEVAEHRVRLGRAHWQLGEAAGEADEAARKQAAALWLQAAAVEGPHQVGLLPYIQVPFCYTSRFLQVLGTCPLSL